MTRKEFLTELENSLEGKLPQDEISEILNDYNDIFGNGIYDGKTEEETAIELGSPAKIARKILEDTPEKQFKSNADKSYTDTRNLASMSSRFGAFAIDTIIGTIILVIIMAAAYIPFLNQERVIWNVDNGGSGYEAKFHKDSNGLTTKVEVLDKNHKNVFDGSSEDFVSFIDSNKLDISKDFSIRKHVTTVKVPFPSRVKLLIFLTALLASNIFNSFITWKLKGYTIGKKLFKIRVQKIDGSAISFMDAIFRELIIKSIANVILCGLLNIGSLIWASLTSERNTVHDRAAKTIVVSVRG